MVREGYKETELGEIPEDWDIKYLNDISEEIGDGIHATPNYVESSEYFFINGKNLKNNRISILINHYRLVRWNSIFSLKN